MRIVIAGAGEVGYNLAKVLCDHHDVYVIDIDEDKVENMKNLNVSAIRGNSASVDVLKSVEILIPRGDRVIKRGGRILVFATWDCIEDLEDVFE